MGVVSIASANQIASRVFSRSPRQLGRYWASQAGGRASSKGQVPVNHNALHRLGSSRTLRTVESRDQLSGPAEKASHIRGQGPSTSDSCLKYKNNHSNGGCP